MALHAGSQLVSPSSSLLAHPHPLHSPPLPSPCATKSHDRSRRVANIIQRVCPWCCRITITMHLGRLLTLTHRAEFATWLVAGTCTAAAHRARRCLARHIHHSTAPASVIAAAAAAAVAVASTTTTTTSAAASILSRIS
jgi:hypothetical protein